MKGEARTMIETKAEKVLKRLVQETEFSIGYLHALYFLQEQGFSYEEAIKAFDGVARSPGIRTQLPEQA
jgi:hypothetical protein